MSPSTAASFVGLWPTASALPPSGSRSEHAVQRGAQDGGVLLRARTLHGLRARMATTLLALAAGVWLNSHLDQPTWSFATFAT